jgi:hypothetical protein
MLSVVVIHKGGDMRPGPGFFTLGQELGRDTSEPDRFWAAEFELVRKAWTPKGSKGTPRNSKRSH